MTPSRVAAIKRGSVPVPLSLLFAVVCALTVGSMTTVRAQPSTAPALPPAVPAPQPAAKPSEPLWELGLGVAAARLPHYRGAGQSRAWVLPVPYAVYRGEYFKADREGARAELVTSPRFVVDFSVAAGAPANSEDNNARSGMRDLAPTVEVGPNFTWRLLKAPTWDLEFRVPLRAGVSLERSPRFVGLVANPNLNFDLRDGPWNYGGYIALPFGSRTQHAYFYDVGLNDVRVDRPGYRSRGGWGGMQYVAGVSRRVGDMWLGGFVRVDNLRGAVFEDSPLVKNKHSVAMGLGISWILSKSTQSAPAPQQPR
jgi:MipA family protein